MGYSQGLDLMQSFCPFWKNSSHFFSPHGVDIPVEQGRGRLYPNSATCLLCDHLLLGALVYHQQMVTMVSTLSLLQLMLVPVPGLSDDFLLTIIIDFRIK